MNKVYHWRSVNDTLSKYSRPTWNMTVDKCMYVSDS